VLYNLRIVLLCIGIFIISVTRSNEYKMNTTTKTQNNMPMAILSAVIMWALVFLGLHSANILKKPENYEMCGTGGPATWAVYYFYFSAIGGGIGAVYETYLILIGKPFVEETIPWVPKTRGYFAGYIFTIGTVFDCFMVFATSEADFLNRIVFGISIIGAFMAPGMFMAPGTATRKAAILWNGGSTVLSMVIILKTGTAFGGAKTTYYLALNKASSFIGSILTPPDGGLQNNIQYHMLRFIANVLVILGYINATDESSCFPQEAGAKISDKLAPTLVAAAAAGWVTMLSVTSGSSSKAKSPSIDVLLGDVKRDYSTVKASEAINP